MCFFLSNPKNQVLAVVIVSILAVALISTAAYYLITNFVTYSQTSTPTSIISAQNWAGYLVATDLTNPQPNVVGVNGSWVVPSVADVGVDAFSAVWVGIGGQFEAALIQVGTEQDFTGGAPSYSAWYEMLPNDAVTIDSMQVSPGDRMEASINLVDPAGNVWSVAIVDLSSGQSFQSNLTYNSGQSSAEWIVERPDINNAISVLADFGSVAFSNCYANLGGNGSRIVDFQDSKVVMYSQTRNGASIQLADVSDLANGGIGFTVNYLTS